MRIPGRKPVASRNGKPRLLVPFIARQLDQVVLDAALRIARVEGTVLVPAYLLLVPLEFSLDAPVQHEEIQAGLNILEAVEHAARRAGVPVDARLERGRTPVDALQRLWKEESFERIVVPAPLPGHSGFSPKELAWMLTHAPSELIVLRPPPRGEQENGGAPASG